MKARTCQCPGAVRTDRCRRLWQWTCWDTDQRWSLEYRPPLDRTMVLHCPLTVRGKALQIHDKKHISKWYRRTLPLEPLHRCKTLPTHTTFSIFLQRSPISLVNRDFFSASWRFFIVMLYRLTVTYLLTNEMLINICGSCVGKHLQTMWW